MSGQDNYRLSLLESYTNSKKIPIDDILEKKKELRDAIKQGLNKDKIVLTLSLDCSNKELYKKIKRIDAYDKVIKNIQKYVKDQKFIKTNARIKYIILPNINDTKEEIENLLTLCKNIGIKKVILDIKTNWYIQNKSNIPEHIKTLIQYFEKRTAELELETDYYSHVAQINFENK